MLNKISQKQAVVNEVNNVLGSTYNPSVPARDQLSDDQLKTIKANISAAIINGTVEFRKRNCTPEEISRYVSGMVSNHLRKAKDLNGGKAYVPESSGRGSRDAQIQELNKLLKTYTEGSDEYIQIVEAINTRKSVLASERAEAAKAKKKQKDLNSIDFDALPEGLQHLANDLVGEINAQ